MFIWAGLDQIGVEIGAEDGLAGLVNLLEEGFFILGSPVLGILPGLASGGFSCKLLTKSAHGLGRPRSREAVRQPNREKLNPATKLTKKGSMASLSRIVLFIGVAFSLGSCTSEEFVRQPTPPPTTTTTVRSTTTTTTNQPVVGIPVQSRPGF